MTFIGHIGVFLCKLKPEMVTRTLSVPDFIRVVWFCIPASALTVAVGAGACLAVFGNRAGSERGYVSGIQLRTGKKKQKTKGELGGSVWSKHASFTVLHKRRPTKEAE